MGTYDTIGGTPRSPPTQDIPDCCVDCSDADVCNPNKCDILKAYRKKLRKRYKKEAKGFAEMLEDLKDVED